MKELTPEKFLHLHLIEGKTYDKIAQEFEVPRKELSKMWETSEEARYYINRAKTLFNSRKGKSEFSKFENDGIAKFYDWFIKQFIEVQDAKCFYCNSKEADIRKLFESGTLSTKRNRGKVLELERRNSTENIYSSENCIFACYFCNNHKSDIISEEDHKKYFAPKIKEYIDSKIQELEKKTNA